MMLTAVLALAGSWASWAKDQPDHASLVKDWQIRTFRVPPGLLFESDAANAESLTTGNLPTANSDEKTIIDYLRLGTKSILKSNEFAGLKFAEGTVLVYDSASGTLVARTNAVGCRYLEMLTALLEQRAPVNLVFQLHVVESDSALMRQIVKDSQTHADLTEQFRQLREMADKGHARILHSARIETRSGQRVKIEAGPEHEHQAGFKVDAQGRVEWKRESQRTGLSFEIDPAIAPDGWGVNVNFDLEYHFAPPTERVEVAGDAGPLGRITVPVTDYHRAKVLTAMTFGDGMTRLIGAWRPSGTEDLDKQDVLQAAFLQANCARLLQEENKTLEAMLSKFADKAIPIPAVHEKFKFGDSNIVDEKPTPNMQTRYFKVPPDFLSLDASTEAGSAPVDPLARNLPAKIYSPKDVQKAAGVPFPEGAAAAFDLATSTLIVTNTPENLDMIDSFTNYGCYRPMGLVHTLHIIEADAATLRKIADETANISDHSKALLKLEALVAQRKARFVSTQQLETRSGQRASIHAGTERMSVTKFRKSDASGEMVAAVDRSPGGTRLEVEPIVGPDGWTIDINLSLDHEFMPAKQEHQGENGGGAKGLETNTTLTHNAHVITATTMRSGFTRIIGLWKPEGAPSPIGKDVLQIAFLHVDRLAIDKADAATEREAAKK